jgi:ActR/RegA family two-component response regulator
MPRKDAVLSRKKISGDSVPPLPRLAMEDLLHQMSRRFERTVNLLLVDDDRQVLKALQRNFTSPAFAITAMDTFDSAKKAAAGGMWHCWVLDIDLGNGRTGMDIMAADKNFPFVIILSGLQSMSTAAEAVRRGALQVFDKDPAAFDQLYAETCKAAALGYVLGGKHTQYLPVYRLLCGAVIASVDEWADKACLSLRQLHRICDIHPVKNPRSTLDLYYAFYLLLWKGARLSSSALPSGIVDLEVEYLTKCLASALKRPV